MMKRILPFATIILLVVTVFWMIAFYEHIRAYDRMVQEAQEDTSLGRVFITWEPFFLWGNFPFFIVSGFILAFAWPILVYGGWTVLKQKHAD